jgi:hypothetical protein
MRGDKRGVRIVTTNQPGQYNLRKTPFSPSTVRPAHQASSENSRPDPPDNAPTLKGFRILTCIAQARSDPPRTQFPSSTRNAPMVGSTLSERMKKIDRVLPAAVESDEILLAARAQALFRDWPAIVGETLARKSWPDRYGKGTVWVAVEGSAWATELRMRKGEILQRLRDRTDNPSIFKDVRFGVRPLPRPPTPPATQEVAPPETEESEPLTAHLTIREIAERRLAKWKSPD